MGAMAMAGSGTMSAVWMPMSPQGWAGAAASFLGMWTLMMAAMMLPSLLPVLWRYRRAVGRTGETRLLFLTALVAGGYLLVWTICGVGAYPLGALVRTATMRHPALGRALPLATALIVLAAGALQLTRWKARHLACCRAFSRACCREIRGGESLGRSRALPARAVTAWRHGLRLGWHCSQCCAGLTTILLVTGIMDVPAMLAVTAAITLERLAPAGERAARAIGVMALGAGLLLAARAVGL